MPVKPTSVTSAGTDRIPLGGEEQEALRILLTKRGEAAEGFVREANASIVAAYDLWRKLSSWREEIAWLEQVEKKGRGTTGRASR